MSPSVAPSSTSVEVRSLDRTVGSSDRLRPAPAKAALRGDRVGPSFRSVMTKAILAYYGSVKATAISLSAPDRPLDESLMQREFAAGKFGRFDDHADEPAKAFVSRELRATFGDLDPKATARRMLDEVLARVEEIREVLR